MKLALSSGENTCVEFVNADLGGYSLCGLLVIARHHNYLAYTAVMQCLYSVCRFGSQRVGYADHCGKHTGYGKIQVRIFARQRIEKLLVTLLWVLHSPRLQIQSERCL